MWQEFGGPLFNRRPHEAVQRTLIAHISGVEHLAQATDNAGLGVREGSIEVEDEGWQ